jgi:sarcosine oxidase gamma subunit
MVPQPYVDGITDTVPHHIASSLTAGQIGITAGDTLSVSVVCPDRWFPGDVAMVTSRDGHTFAGEVAGMDVCTGQVAIRLPGSRARELPALHGPAARVSAGVL